MTISKKQLEDEKNYAYQTGRELGIRQGEIQAKESFNLQKIQSQVNLLHAAAELAQANAKLTYAISQMFPKQ